LTASALEKPPRIFYGWYIVAVALLAQFVAIGSQAYAGGVFLKPMTEDLGWSREAFSAVQTVSTVVMGGLGLVVGILIDRRDPRLLMLTGGIIAGGALVLVSTVDTLWQFYLIRGVGQTAGNALLGNLVVNVTVSRWFVAKRGMAIAIAATGVSLGGVLMTPLIAWWVEDFGWRTAWVLLGIMVWVIVLPSSQVMRRSPEERGLLPDGMTAEEAALYSQTTRRVSAVSEVQWTRSEAVRTRSIWLVIVAFGAANVGLGAMLLHLIAFLSDHGFSRTTAAGLFTVMSWLALLTKFVWGFLIDRFHVRYLSAVGFSISALAILALIPAGESGSVLVVALVLALYGAGIGGVIPLQETVWASYFGRTHLGKIRSIAMPFSIVFSAGGPLLAGALFDRTGGYTLALTLFTAFYFLGALLILLAKPPRRRPEELSEPVDPKVAAASATAIPGQAGG
jgi:MFS transporter, OFA family, oxalate/formate antiporter